MFTFVVPWSAVDYGVLCCIRTALFAICLKWKLKCWLRQRNIHKKRMCSYILFSSQNINNRMSVSLAGSFFFRIDAGRRKYLIQFVIRAVSRETYVTWLNVTWPRATMSIERDIRHGIIWRPRASERAGDAHKAQGVRRSQPPQPV